FLEQQALYDLPKDGDPRTLTRNQRTGAQQLLASPLDIITCPSRRPGGGTFTYAGGGMYNSNVPEKTGRSDYAANAGTVYVETRNDGEFPGNYAAADTFAG